MGSSDTCPAEIHWSVFNPISRNSLEMLENRDEAVSEMGIRQRKT
uniref:Uncharacterized protein n=1 Tax=Manihot esculenta TaxID=3983 RepID=A0A2C9UEI0_MANES